MDVVNIRIAKKTHRRLNLLKGQLGMSDTYMLESAPTLDDVINAGLDLLEQRTSGITISPQEHLKISTL